MAQHILFDLDGTLVNSFDGITNSIRYALEKMGKPVPPDEVLYPFLGPPLGESFRKILGMDETEATLAVAMYREYFREKGIAEHSLYPGIEDMLDALLAAGKQLYVATSKPRLFADAILKSYGLTDKFVQVWGSGMDVAGAPKVQIVAEVLQQNNIDPADAIMVGDRRFDMSGAVQNGVLPVGAVYGFGTEQELSDAGAHALAHDVPQLTALLLQL